MAERRVLTTEEFEQMRAALRDPDHLAHLAADAKAQGLVEVDNPMRREVRPRRGTEARDEIYLAPVGATRMLDDVEYTKAETELTGTEVWVTAGWRRQLSNVAMYEATIDA